MGKRSKVRNVSNEDPDVSNKKIKVKKNQEKNTSENLEVSITEQTINDVVLPVVEKKKKNKKNKSKLNKSTSKDSDASTTKEIDDVVVETVEKKPKRKPKSTEQLTNDDESIEVPAASGTTNNKQKKKKPLNDDEAEVKEEDIDKFCDELDEEDNKQYEDWVKLIEANFRSNKKT